MRVPLLFVVLCLSVIHVQSFTFWTMKVRGAFPHDPNAFTEGLLLAPESRNETNLDKLIVYESSGVPSNSELRQVDLASGRVLNKAKLAHDWGQGIAIVDNTIYQLTFAEERIRGFNLSNVDAWLNESSAISTQSMPADIREGWGLTSTAFNHNIDPVRLYASDGTSQLYMLNTTTMKKISSVTVHFPRQSISQSNNEPEITIDGLNELEVVKSQVWANLFGRNCIARIDPSTGEVLGMILKSDEVDGGNHPAVRVMNGIAWHPASRTVFVTGKLWSNIYQVKIVATKQLDDMVDKSSPKDLFDRLCPMSEFTEEDQLFQQTLSQAD